MLAKWEMVRVRRPDLRQPHDKYCICIDWQRRWFFYINSEPPAFRKAREVAVMVANFEVHGLTKVESFIDTTQIVDDLPEQQLEEAVADDSRRYGFLAPFVRQRICDALMTHGALTAEQRLAILGE